MAKKEIKNIAVFCGSSYGNDPQIADDIKRLGYLLGTRGTHVFYGGGLYGNLQDFMEEVGKSGGTMDAVLPPAYFKPDEIYPDHVNVIPVKSDEERIRHFLQAEAFIITPGGDGTTAEAFFAHNQNLSALFQKQTQKPMVFMNTNGFYKHLRGHFNHLVEQGYSNNDRQARLYFEKAPVNVINRIVKTLK